MGSGRGWRLCICSVARRRWRSKPEGPPFERAIAPAMEHSGPALSAERVAHRNDYRARPCALLCPQVRYAHPRSGWSSVFREWRSGQSGAPRAFSRSQEPPPLLCPPSAGLEFVLKRRDECVLTSMRDARRACSDRISCSRALDLGVNFDCDASCVGNENEPALARGFHLAHVDAGDAGRSAATDRVRPRGAHCFSHRNVFFQHFLRRAFDCSESAQIAWACGSDRSRCAGCAGCAGCACRARWPGRSLCAVERFQNARLDLVGACD
jgi:hypothetical protein